MGMRRYTDEEHKFLQAFFPGHTYKEIVDEFNRLFDEPITVSRVKAYGGNHKISTGLTGSFKKGHIPANKGTHPPTVGRMAETQFKKGNLPHNTKPIGWERITRDGYIEVKVKMRPSSPLANDNFKLKHRLIWEELHGPIPEGYIVTFLDGNKQNLEPANLALISRGEHGVMAKKGLRSNNPELTETGRLIARTILCRNRAKKRKEKKYGRKKI